jgi:L-2-hydroxyglutarate oxidase LhgO
VSPFAVLGNVAVGPTATPQPESRHDRSTDTATLDELVRHAVAVVPALEEATFVGSFSGLRPATEHRDYQIAAHAAERWVTVGGIRSTGLSASPAIGEYVAELAEAVIGADGDAARYVPPEHVADAEAAASMGVSAAVRARAPLVHCPGDRPAKPAPTLEALRRAYRSSDGRAALFGGLHRVTHPLTSFGLEPGAQ